MSYTFEKPGIPIEALAQDETWFDAKGMEYTISEMNAKHAYYASKKLKEGFGMYALKTPLFKALVKQSKGFVK